MSPSHLDGIPPTDVTMPTRRAFRTRVLALIAWAFLSAVAPAQQPGAPPAPDPARDAPESQSRSVPEPDTLVLFLAGASLLAFYHLHRRRKGETKPTTA